MMLSTTLILILLTSSIAYPHGQQLRYHGQDVILVTNYDHVTETTEITAADWVRGGDVPNGFIRTRFSLIDSRPPRLF